MAGGLGAIKLVGRTELMEMLDGKVIGNLGLLGPGGGATSCGGGAGLEWWSTTGGMPGDVTGGGPYI